MNSTEQKCKEPTITMPYRRYLERLALAAEHGKASVKQGKKRGQRVKA